MFLEVNKEAQESFGSITKEFMKIFDNNKTFRMIKDMNKGKVGKIKTQVISKEIMNGDLSIIDYNFLILVQFSSGNVNVTCF